MRAAEHHLAKLVPNVDQGLYQPQRLHRSPLQSSTATAVDPGSYHAPCHVEDQDGGLYSRLYSLTRSAGAERAPTHSGSAERTQGSLETSGQHPAKVCYRRRGTT